MPTSWSWPRATSGPRYPGRSATCSLTRAWWPTPGWTGRWTSCGTGSSSAWLGRATRPSTSPRRSSGVTAAVSSRCHATATSRSSTRSRGGPGCRCRSSRSRRPRPSMTRSRASPNGSAPTATTGDGPWTRCGRSPSGCGWRWTTGCASGSSVTGAMPGRSAGHGCRPRRCATWTAGVPTAGWRSEPVASSASRRRGSGCGSRVTAVVEVDRILLATGPDESPAGNPFLAGAVEAGLFRPGPLGLGLDADPATLRALDAAGSAARPAYVIGPLLKGVLWETTAIPEIREQAASIAVAGCSWPPWPSRWRRSRQATRPAPGAGLPSPCHRSCEPTADRELHPPATRAVR